MFKTITVNILGSQFLDIFTEKCTSAVYCEDIKFEHLTDRPMDVQITDSQGEDNTFSF